MFLDDDIVFGEGAFGAMTGFWAKASEDIAGAVFNIMNEKLPTAGVWLKKAFGTGSLRRGLYCVLVITPLCARRPRRCMSNGFLAVPLSGGGWYSRSFYLTNGLRGPVCARPGFQLPRGQEIQVGRCGWRAC